MKILHPVVSSLPVILASTYRRVVKFLSNVDYMGTTACLLCFIMLDRTVSLKPIKLCLQEDIIRFIFEQKLIRTIRVAGRGMDGFLFS